MFQLLKQFLVHNVKIITRVQNQQVCSYTPGVKQISQSTYGNY